MQFSSDTVHKIVDCPKSGSGHLPDLNLGPAGGLDKDSSLAALASFECDIGSLLAVAVTNPLIRTIRV